MTHYSAPRPGSGERY